MVRCLAFAAAVSALMAAVPEALPAKPPSAEEASRQAQVIAELEQQFATETDVAKKVHVLKLLMELETIGDVRLRILGVAEKLPTAQLDSFFQGVLKNDPDSGIRSKAAEVLGRLGSEKCLSALATAAASDKTTEFRAGCIGGNSSARRDATFALAALAKRHPTLKSEAVKKLQAIEPAAEPKGEQLADARLQAMYQLTKDESLVKVFYERIRSDDPNVRKEGIVALRFLDLKAVPPELSAALKDPDAEVRSWAALVLGEIRAD